ncbi:MAG: hypothetical protein LUK37_09220 [Clostridia bacterium]|nr:hypothetical protein [Clostridia bacterium]
MDRRQINALTDIDIPSLRLEDIRFLFGTGMGMTKGRGRDKEKFFRKGVQTEIGDIREDVWYQLAEQVIGLHGETWLLEALETWYREMKHYPRHGFDVHKMALELHSNRIFNSEGWIDYLRFNRRFRPEVLEGRRFPKVRVDCCQGEICEVTEEMIQRGSAPCPRCGAFRDYEVIEWPGRE